jgi:hypothetical protein
MTQAVSKQRILVAKNLLVKSECHNIGDWLSSIARRFRTPWGVTIENYRQVAQNEPVELSSTQRYWFAGASPTISHVTEKKGRHYLIVLPAAPSVIWNRNGGHVICCASEDDLKSTKS